MKKIFFTILALSLTVMLLTACNFVGADNDTDGTESSTSTTSAFNEDGEDDDEVSSTIESIAPDNTESESASEPESTTTEEPNTDGESAAPVTTTAPETSAPETSADETYTEDETDDGVEREYNEKGLCIKETETGENGYLNLEWVKTVYTYTYNENDDMSTSVMIGYDEDGKVVAEETMTFSYTESSTSAYAVFKDADGAIIEERTENYSRDGYLLLFVQKRYIDREIVETAEIKCTYDSADCLMREESKYFYAEECYADEEAGYYEYITQYNEDGNEVYSLSVEYDLDKVELFRGTNESEYSEDGKLVREAWNAYQKGADNTYSYMLSEYDEHERLVKVTSKDYTAERVLFSLMVYEYEYDEEDNLLRDVTVTYSPEDSSLEYSVANEYEYDENGDISKIISIKYDKDGNEEEREVFEF